MFSIEKFFNSIITVKIMNQRTCHFSTGLSTPLPLQDLINKEWSLIQADTNVNYFFFKVTLKETRSNAPCIHGFKRTSCRMKVSPKGIKIIESIYKCTFCGLTIKTISTYKTSLLLTIKTVFTNR